VKTLLLPDVGTDLTVEDLVNLPKVDGYEYELDEGRLRIVAAAAMRYWHGEMQFRVLTWLRANGRNAFPEAGVIRADGTTRTPDVGVLWNRPGSSQTAYSPARDYAIVVEIISPKSANEDGFEKPRLYAAAGIPEYWLVEPHPDDDWDALVRMYKLDPTTYVLARTVAWSELEATPRA
jgi:Uma2 family endonuclease